MRFALMAFGVLALVATGQPAAQAPDGLTVSVGEESRVVPGRVLDSLARDTVAASYHDGPVESYVGVAVHRLLGRAGLSAEGLRGAALAQYLVVEARDGYRVAFGMGEVDPAITGRTIILARSADPQAGPWRLVVPGDRRGARWVRQVSTLRVRPVAR
jgi:hypothetical protein